MPLTEHLLIKHGSPTKSKRSAKKNSTPFNKTSRNNLPYAVTFGKDNSDIFVQKLN